MATQKPISTISYNSKSFLLEKLDTWYSQHIIQCYQVIFHKGEDGDKDHAHVRIEPNKKLDVMDLTEALKEYVIDNDKPLGCRPWKPSKEEDWFLYAVHDKKYLELKGEDKGEKLPYDYKDIIVSEGYDLDVAFIRAKQKMKHTTPNIVNQLNSGVKPIDLVSQGENVFAVNQVYNLLYKTEYTELLAEKSQLQCDYVELYNKLQRIEEALKMKNLVIVEEENTKKITIEEKIFE